MSRTTCLLATLSCLTVCVAQQFTAVEHARSWWEAVKSCRDQGRRLLMNPDLLSSTQGWLGARLVQSQWMWSDGRPLYPYQGCYTSGGLQGRRTSFQNNTVTRCMRRCSTIPNQPYYVALQGDNCMCLDGLPLRPTSKADCTLPCPDDPQLSCGGQTAVSVYRDDGQHFPWQPTDTAEDCAYLHWSFQSRPSLQSVRMKADRCDSHVAEWKRFLCLQCKEAGQRCSPIVNAIYKTWEQANSSCLLAPATQADKPPFRFQPGTDERYWIGLSRRTRWTWLNGQEVTAATTRDWRWPRGEGRCLAANVGAGGRLLYQARPCSDVLPFACQEDTAITASVSRPSTGLSTETTTMSMSPSSASSTTSVSTSTTLAAASPSTQSVSTTIPSTTSPAASSSVRSTNPATSTAPTPAVTDAATTVMTSGTSPSSSKTISTMSTADTKAPASLPSVTSDSTSPSLATSGPAVKYVSPTPSTSDTSTLETDNVVPDENFNIGLYAGLGAMGVLLIAIITLLCVCMLLRRRRTRRQLLYSVTDQGEPAGADNSVVLAVGPDEVFVANSMYGRTEKRVRLRSLKDLEMDAAIYARPFKPGREELVLG